MGAATRFEYLVGLDVADDDGYARYRAGMMPILGRYGGAFRYDFRGPEVLRSETDAPINRLFVLGFPDRASADGFFADEAYLEVRRAHFEPSVRSTTILAQYERAAV